MRVCKCIHVYARACVLLFCAFFCRCLLILCRTSAVCVLARARVRFYGFHISTLMPPNLGVGLSDFTRKKNEKTRIDGPHGCHGYHVFVQGGAPFFGTCARVHALMYMYMQIMRASISHAHIRACLPHAIAHAYALKKKRMQVFARTHARTHTRTGSRACVHVRALTLARARSGMRTWMQVLQLLLTRRRRSSMKARCVCVCVCVCMCVCVQHTTRMLARAPTHTHTQTRVRAHTHTHTHTVPVRQDNGRTFHTGK